MGPRTIAYCKPVELRPVASWTKAKRQLRKICSMSGSLLRGSSIKQLVVINWLFLPQYSDVVDRTVDSCCTVYVLLKHLTQQVAHGLSNADAPPTITQGMTGKIQNSVLQTYPSVFYPLFHPPPGEGRGISRNIQLWGIILHHTPSVWLSL